MSTNILNFMLQLAKDPQAAEDFVADPDTTARKAGLTDAQIEAVKTRDSDTIRESIIAESPELVELRPGGSVDDSTIMITITIRF